MLDIYKGCVEYLFLRPLIAAVVIDAIKTYFVKQKEENGLRLRAGHTVSEFDSLVVVGCFSGCLVHF